MREVLSFPSDMGSCTKKFSIHLIEFSIHLTDLSFIVTIAALPSALLRMYII